MSITFQKSRHPARIDARPRMGMSVASSRNNIRSLFSFHGMRNSEKQLILCTVSCDAASQSVLR